MAEAREVARPSARQRTRKALLEAASRLMQQGRTPTLDDVAAEAQVSRATAYRYFAGIEALLLEAALDVAFPTAEQLFEANSDDPLQRLEQVDAAVEEMIAANEALLRMLMIQSLQRALRGDAAVLRQNRRTPLIEAALAPARSQLNPRAHGQLTKALALVVGTEAMLVLKDVLGLKEKEARDIRRWTIRALVAAARA